MDISELLRLLVKKQASDLHLKVGSKPVFRVDGLLMPEENLSPIVEKDVEMAFERIANPEQRSIFLKNKDLHFAYSLSGLARFRVSAMRQRGTMGISFRVIPFEIQEISGLELPEKIKEIILRESGLILVTGAVGSGKSTTLSAIIDYINRNKRRNIVTIEKTIEYLHKDIRCMISQRDIGDDALSFPAALKHAQSHDADIIAITEMRDTDTISNAIEAAEIGKLVIGVLNASNTIQAIDILVELFQYDKQAQIRMQLSRVLEAVISQKLVKRIKGGRVAAFEILSTNKEVKGLIREANMPDLEDKMRSSKNGDLFSMERSIAELVKNGTIVMEDINCS
jgi:twitching motility protein PilT